MSATTAIAPGSLVLVTGANGYIGSHICDRLVRAGYRVRGTARDPTKIAYLEEVIAARYPKADFSYVVVKDMNIEGAYDAAMEGVAGVVHVASNMTFSNDADVVIGDVLNGVNNILKTAAKHQSVKRFVYTSSSSATTFGGLDVPYHVDSNTWNDASIELAKTMPADSPQKGGVVYAASKTAGERACFDFVQKVKPSFTLNTIVPSLVIGEILHRKQPAHTAGILRQFYEGQPDNVERVKAVAAGGVQVVDVKDVADLHLAALQVEDVQGERLFAYSEKAPFNKFVDYMQAIDAPGKNPPAHIKSPGEDLGTLDKARSEDLLKKMNGRGFASMRDALLANITSEWDGGSRA